METLIYGTKEGQPEYMEQLLYDGGLNLNEKQIEMIKTAASKDGFTNFRVCSFTAEKPDFTKAINI